MKHSRRYDSVFVFIIMTLLFGVMATWLLHNNYINDAAQYNLATVKAIFDAKSVHLENFGFFRPHGPLLVLSPFNLVPKIQPYSPFIISAIVTAFLLALWNRQLKVGGYTVIQRLLLLTVTVANPAILWSATSGGNEAITLLMFYLLYRSCLRMIYDKDIRSFIALGLVLAIFLYFDVISVYLFAVLLPLLLLVIPIPVLRESPVSVYIIIGMPLMIVVIMWLYFNLIFSGEPLAFLNTQDSAFSGAITYAETLPWLRDYGGQLLAPTLTGATYIVASYPVLLFLIMRNRLEHHQYFITPALLLYPIVTVGIATFTYFLASPLQITTLIMASVMAEMGRAGCFKPRCMKTLLSLLIIGATVSWFIFVKSDYSTARKWVMAIEAPQSNEYSGDTLVGYWLSNNRRPTMMDFASGYRAIIARGDAKGLLLPFTHEYRLAMRSDQPTIPQIAVPDPDTSNGRRDSINFRFPHLYESGMPGYKRVYDESGWRVYRRVY